MNQTSGSYSSRFTQTSPKRCVLWLVAGMVAALTMALAGPVAHAQEGYPQPIDPYVNDYAELLTAEDAANIRTLFADLKNETGIEAVVVTIDSISDYSTGDETFESFATSLFNTWSIGDSERNDGVLILVAVGDRAVRIELGSGYGSAYNSGAQEVINEHMLPSFKRDDYSGGIYSSAQAVVGILAGTGSPDLTPTLTRAVTPPPPPPSASSTNILVVILGGAIATLGRFWPAAVQTLPQATLPQLPNVHGPPGRRLCRNVSGRRSKTREIPKLGRSRCLEVSQLRHAHGAQL